MPELVHGAGPAHAQRGLLQIVPLATAIEAFLPSTTPQPDLAVTNNSAFISTFKLQPSQPIVCIHWHMIHTFSAWPAQGLLRKPFWQTLWIMR